MASKSESVVGSKEELYPPKSVRKALGLRPGMKVRFRVEGRHLIVEPLPTVEDLSKMEPTVSVTLKELREDRGRLSKRLEEGRGAEW